MTDTNSTSPRPVSEEQTLERGALTGSGAIQAIATATLSGAAGGAAGAITTKLLNRPPKDEAPAAPQPKIVLPPGAEAD
jgi:hypothetical protein